MDEEQIQIDRDHEYEHMGPGDLGTLQDFLDDHEGQSDILKSDLEEAEPER